MLASEAGIVFPALIICEDDMYFREALDLKDLDSVDWNLIDSAGQRFLIRAFIAVPLPFERGTPLWKRWLFPRSRPHRYDAELDALPPQPFEETLRIALKNWAEHEDYWVMEGGGRDTPEMWEGYRQSKTIADICNWNTPPPGSPSVADSIVEDLQKLGRWMMFRGGRKQ